MFVDVKFHSVKHKQNVQLFLCVCDRVYSKPPPLVETVMSAVCVLFQRKPDWPTAKLMLGDQGFLRRLLQFDKNAVPDKVSGRAGSLRLHKCRCL